LRNVTFDLPYVGTENTTDETAGAIVHRANWEAFNWSRQS